MLPPLLMIYQWLIPLFKRGVLAYVRHRLKKGKEDPERLGERFGKASKMRPQGSVVWFHGASVGEAVSLLPLLRKIREKYSDITLLITTGTVTAATVITKSLPEGCIHQYSPIDVPSWIEAFLNHWKPDMAVFVESEFWPNLLLKCEERKIPLYLINASLSQKSFKSWQRFPSVIRRILSCFEVCLAQSEMIAQRLIDLGAPPSKVRVCGNMKFSASPLPFDEAEMLRLRTLIQERPVWVAASTHAGEEEIVSEVHDHIKKALPSLLTILIPRHPMRGEEIAEDLRDSGYQVAVRSSNDVIENSTDIYLVDTIGELGLFYRLSKVVFLGGTFVPIGGHNPIEPAMLECAIIWGPYIHKQTEICNILHPAVCPVVTKEEFTTAVGELLMDPAIREEKITNARQLIDAHAHVMDHIIDAFKEKLEELSGGSDGTRTRGLRRDRPAL